MWMSPLHPAPQVEFTDADTDARQEFEAVREEVGSRESTGGPLADPGAGLPAWGMTASPATGHMICSRAGT